MTKRKSMLCKLNDDRIRESGYGHFIIIIIVRLKVVKHIIIWTLKDSFSDTEKETIKANIKTGLEGLMGKIDGLTEIKVQTGKLPSSNGDLMLDSTFESVDALKAYAVHPAHVEVADRDVRPYTATRSCIDFEV